MKKIRVAIIGYGNIGEHAAEAVLAAQDMELAGVVRRDGAKGEAPKKLPGISFMNEEQDISNLGSVDVAVLCKPTRMIEEYAKKYLSLGIHTVDSFDIHNTIVDIRKNLQNIAVKNKAVAIISAGWDPGSDSVVRTLLEAAAPVGITYTNFGPGMSMGHSVVARSKPGVKDALSVTIPLGTGIHRRMLYLQLEDKADIEKVSGEIRKDDYFRQDELHIIPVPDISVLMDKGHGVNMVRKGRSGSKDNQLFTFEMRINNPALTAQVMVSCARACTRQQPGVYTMIEIPPVDLLEGNREEIINRLV